jgi:hypothetical protein
LNLELEKLETLELLDCQYPFSIKVVTATFQAMMDDIFITMINNQLVIVYMGDILIFADTKEELEQITKLVLKKL